VKSPAGTPAAVADGVGLLAFVLVGLRIHGAPYTAAHILRDALPLLAAWYAAAMLSRLYQDPRWFRLLANWGIAIPLWILLRQLWVGRLLSRATAVFLVMALGFTLLFLITGRLLTALLARAASPRGPSPG